MPKPGADSDQDAAVEEAAAGADSDPDFSDGAAPKKKRKPAAPRRPRAPKAAARGGRGGGVKAAKAAKAEEVLESDVELSDLDDGEH